MQVHFTSSIRERIEPSSKKRRYRPSCPGRGSTVGLGKRTCGRGGCKHPKSETIHNSIRGCQILPQFHVLHIRQFDQPRISMCFRSHVLSSVGYRAFDDETAWNSRLSDTTVHHPAILCRHGHCWFPRGADHLRPMAASNGPRLGSTIAAGSGRRGSDQVVETTPARDRIPGGGFAAKRGSRTVQITANSAK